MYNQIHLLNTFTAHGMGGNPTAVYLSHRPLHTEAMQILAREIPVPVTAFVWEEESDCHIRYFTQRGEIAACGHATLGAAAVCAEIWGKGAIGFRTPDDTVVQTIVDVGKASIRYAAVQPAPAYVEQELLSGCGLQPGQITETWRKQNTLVLVLKEAEDLRRLQPDFRRLQQSSTLWDEVAITAKPTTGDYDYVLRSFCPWIGIDEDPVTGSVHAALAPYWAKRLQKSNLAAFQLSDRGGEILICVKDNWVQVSGGFQFLSATANYLSSHRKQANHDPIHHPLI